MTMKCKACGHEYIEDKYSTTGKEFILLTNIFSISEESNEGFTYLHEKSVNLYACPECGTVRMER